MDVSGYNLEVSMGRVRRILWALAVLGFWAFALTRGWSWAASFLAGALLAIVGFHLTHRFVMAIGPGGNSKPKAWHSVLLGGRYLILAGVVWLLLRLLGLQAVGVLCGLLIVAVAVIWEMIRELAQGGR